MKRFNGGTVFLVCWLFVWFFQPFTQTYGVAAEPERISLNELKTLLDNAEDVIVVDVRSKHSYDRGHIPGAISIPLPEIEDRHQELPQDKTIILYCS